MLDKIIDIVSEQLGIEASSITSESKIIDDLGADSLDVVELVMALEDEISIEIPSETIANFVTIGDVVTYLDSLN